MSTPPTRDELIARLTERRERLEQWFISRTADELERPLTPSEVEGGAMWRAKDHLAHAAGTERYLMGVVRRTLAGAEDPAGFFTRLGSLDADTVMRAINESNQSAYAKYHDEPTASLLERMRETRQTTMALLTSLSEEQLDQPSPHSPFGHGSVRDLFRQLAHHDKLHLDWLAGALDQTTRGA
jgi:hypothetical protein